MKALLKNLPAVIRYPHAIRPWQHVLEPLRGYLILAEQMWVDGTKFAEAWNFGPNDEDAKPVSWIADYMTKLWGPHASWELDPTEHPPEATYLKLDCSKAKRQLGWSPKLHLSEALEWTVEWYKGFGQGKNMSQMTEDQISRYESRE